jgi:hypothetical protein
MNSNAEFQSSTFPEFLVKSGAISKEDLLKGLYEQVSKTPGLFEIAYKHHLMSTDQLIEICNLQMKDGLSFSAAAERLKMWNRDLELKLSKYMNEGRPSLVRLLVESKAISIEKLTEEVETYNVSFSRTQVTSQSKNQTSKVVSESLFEGELYNIKCLCKVLASIESLESLDILDNLILFDLEAGAREAHVLVSTSRFMDRENLERAAIQLEKVLTTLVHYKAQTKEEQSRVQKQIKGQVQSSSQDSGGLQEAIHSWLGLRSFVKWLKDNPGVEASPEMLKQWIK